MARAVAAMLSGSLVLEGAGVRLERVFGFQDPERFDPFLLLDDFRSDNPADYAPGFPWHPHRGIETITLLLKGEVVHGDSLGNSGVIGPGEVQWMTAGSGVVHQEMPRGDENGSMHGFQLWANLPAAHKMTAPRYRSVAAADIPAVRQRGGASVRVVAGELQGVRGPVSDVFVAPEYFLCDLPPGARFAHEPALGHTVMAYGIGGSGLIQGVEFRDRSLALLAGDGEVAVQAGPRGASFLFLSGRPLHEPIAWRGPIVMNTQAELDLAFREFREGNFIKS